MATTCHTCATPSSTPVWVSSPYTANQNSSYHPERPLPVPHVEYDASSPPCGLCEEGKWHPICVGPEPETHPCLRVWGKCKYSDTCVFKNLPRTWCLYCCRRAEHRQCNGVPPEVLPNVSGDIQRKCKDHAGQMKQKFQARRAKVKQLKALSESSVSDMSEFSECDSVGHASLTESNEDEGEVAMARGGETRGPTARRGGAPPEHQSHSPYEVLSHS